MVFLREVFVAFKKTLIEEKPKVPLGTILLTWVWAIHRVGTFSCFAWGWRRPHSRKGAVSPPAGTPTGPGKVVAFHSGTLTAGED